jgi:DNA-binding NarL/FixJ family response regulator
VGTGAGAGFTVLIVDDHESFREQVRNLLELNGIAVAGEAGSAAEAVALAAELKPDVVLMDLSLPDGSGIKATRRVRLASPITRVLALTFSTDEQDVSEALEFGACGYVLKDSDPDEIIAGIRAAADGQALLSPRVAAVLLERIRNSVPATQIPEGFAPQLSDRELEVLSLIADGKSNVEIAEDLVISEQTVKNHVSSILVKLEVENRIQAAVVAVRNRLV